MSILSPFVYWAQDEKTVFLKVDLKDVKDPAIIVSSHQIQFQAQGFGAQGCRTYEFKLDLFSNINEEEKKLKISDNSINFTLSKLEPGWWPRLISQPQKPPWVKIDFDRWKSEIDLLDENVNDVRQDFPDLYQQLQKEEIGYRKEDFKKIYLFLYNLFMFVGFLYVMVILVISYMKEGPVFFSQTYATLGSVVCALQLLQYLEVMHPMFGYVKGGILMPFMQITGRAFILFAMLEPEPRIQKMPVIFYLFFAWTASEISRYPYYMSQIFKKEIYILTWLRYSCWIILYPLGLLCEAVIIFRNIFFVHASQKWSITMPNSWNFTFDFLIFLRIYLLVLLFPGAFTLLRHMYNTRVKKLGGSEPFIRNIFSKNK